MDKQHTPALVRWSAWIYAQLLRGYPRPFRQDYGPQVVQLYRDLCREVYGRAGLPGLLGLWLTSLGDLGRNGLGEYRALGRRSLAAPASGPVQVVLRQGTRWGFGAGAALVLLILVTNFVIVEQDDTGSVLLGYSLLFLACALAGFVARRRAGAIPAGTLTGALTGVIVAAVVTLTYTAIDLIGYSAVTARPERIAAFQASGLPTMGQYMLLTTLLGAAVLLMVGVVAGTVFGTLGAVLGRLRLSRS